MRLVSINVERSKHLDKVLPFLKRMDPDVVCVQELHEPDTSLFEDIVGKCVVSAPNCWHVPDVLDCGAMIMETAIFTKLSIRSVSTHYYAGSRMNALTSAPKEYVKDHCLLGCDVMHGADVFRVMTTHFTWSEKGATSALQCENMLRLLEVLKKSGNFILAGDFNAPRGGEMFSVLASGYKDNIPAHYETSIDLDLHGAGKTRAHELKDKMVDGLFTTPLYVASNVELVFGVSDHAAIVADISLA